MEQLMDDMLSAVEAMEHKRSRREVQQSFNSLTFEWQKVGEENVRQSTRFRRIERRAMYKVTHNLGDFTNLYEVSAAIDSLFESVMQPYLAAAAEEDIISINITHSKLESDIFIPPQRKKSFNREAFLDRIFDIAQSNKEFLIDGEFMVTVAIMKNIRGKGHNDTHAPKKLTERSHAKKSVVVIKNEDNSCFLRALAVAIFQIYNGKNRKKWTQMIQNRRNVQKEMAMDLGRQVKIEWDTPVTYSDIESIQNRLQYQLVIVDARNPKNLLFKGPSMDITLYLEYVDSFDGDGHFNCITNITKYMGGGYYCKECHVSFKDRKNHFCKNACTQCNALPKCEEKKSVVCGLCHRQFYGLECLRKHTENSVCIIWKCCEYCGREYRADDIHDCERYVCSRCGDWYTIQPHFCFIEGLDKKDTIVKDKIPKYFVAYDVESTQDNGRHCPNLVMSQTVCDVCWDEKQMEKNCLSCEKCGVGLHQFFGANCIERFCNYLFEDLAKRAQRNESRVLVFAHNAKGYDAHFLIQDLWKRGFQESNVIIQGRKIMRMKTGNVSMIDSLAFFLQPLAALPKAFGLNVELTKGYFPHYFNKEENYTYGGPIPELKYYGVEYLKPDAASKLKEWHQQQVDSNYVFNFMEELIRYCKNDVDILIKSIMVFRKNVKEITGIDAFTKCFTLASLGLEVYRNNFLEGHVLGITPINGYSSQRAQSKAAQCWLDWKQHELGVTIIREYKIGKFIVDGCEPESKRVFEFFGCRFHGCPCHYKDNRDSKLIPFQKSANELHYAAREKVNFLITMGFEVNFVWECEYKEWKKQFPVFKDYCKERFDYYTSLEKHGVAQISEAFFGGRTNNLRFYYECEADEEICYVDFISLYPDVLKNRPYPIGHPEVIRENFDYSLQSYFGFVKCKVIAPKGIYFPVLPYKVNKKLLFPLCHTCAKEQNKSDCTHSDDERMMINTWTTEELKVALLKVYRIVSILEVLHWKQISDELFKGYINMWLKIKQQASGWPSWCQSEEQKQEFIAKYLEHEGIALEYEKIERNEALRFIAKIMLNSFWGKLAQRPNMPTTELVNTYAQYMDIVDDECREIKGEIMPTNNCMMVTTQYKDTENARQGLTNLAVASYVTAYARLKLFWLVDRIEKQRPFSVLYHDTDSVIFYRKLTDPRIETGDFLGELTDEFEGYKGAVCKKFASLGPKNYGYELQFPDGTTKANMKAKGISLTSNTIDLVNFKNMVKLALEYTKGTQIKLNCPQQQIRSDAHHILYTRQFEKVYQGTGSKRFIDGNITLPYGY